MRIKTKDVIYKYYDDRTIFGENFGIKIYDRWRNGFLSHFIFFGKGEVLLKKDLQHRIYKTYLFKKSNDN